MIYADGGNVAVLDTRTMKLIDTIEIGSGINSLTVSDDGRTLLVACWDNTGRVVDCQTKKSVIIKGHTGRVNCIIECGSRDVLTCSHDKTICRWNRWTDERILIRTFSGHSKPINSIICNWKTKKMISASDDMTMIVWNVETGDRIGLMKGHSGEVLSLAFVNSTTIVSGSGDKTVKIWDTTTMKEIKTISAHTDNVRSVAVTPDGEYVVSGSDDATVKVSSIATGECITTLFFHHTHRRFVYKVAVSHDGRFIAAGGSDRTVSFIKVSPPFPFIVHEESLINSSHETTDHHLFSDGTLRSNEFFLSITPSSICTINTENPLSFAISSITHNHNASFSASTASSLQQWIEAIYAVQHNLALHPDKRSNSSHDIRSRYRFDLIQFISIHNKQEHSSVLIPKDVMKVIGNYLVGI
jgi:WD40 repeat protein